MMFSLLQVFLLLHILSTITRADSGDNRYRTCDRYIDVAIVGAGTAGTYAAYRLRDLGSRVELFEFSDRIGGRAYTTSLDNVPDLKLDLGAMRFLDGVHKRTKQLAKKLDLTVQVFTEGFGRSGRSRYNFRGVSLTPDEVFNGDVPYDLSEEEKANQHRLFSYYLEKLTGYNESYLPHDEVFKLKLLSDGTELYKLTFDEAMDLVATPEGKEFAKALAVFQSVTSDDVTTLQVFMEWIPEPGTGDVLTLKEGMGALPQALAEAFTEKRSMNKITFNRMLRSIRRIGHSSPASYQLEFWKTFTEDGVTRILRGKENVCAEKVILAIPQFALARLDWEPLGERRVREALGAVKPIPLSKVYMTFPTCWWLTDVDNPAYVMTTDTNLAQMYDWKQSNVSGDCAMLASYADFDKALYQAQINQKGRDIRGSAAGANAVRQGLENKLLGHFSDVFGIPRNQIPTPRSAISHFWHSYPYGGGVTLWRAGYKFDEVGCTLRRPSLTDDVFIVGSDHSFGTGTAWMEGAFRTVDDVMDNFFTIL